jgi:Sensors of blue-light using FAD
VRARLCHYGDVSSQSSFLAKYSGEIFSLVYISTATKDMDDEDLAVLLAASRVKNHKVLISGFLLYKDGRFLQYLEGPEAAVRAKMATIATDSRHKTIAILLEETRSDRQFADWAMGFERHDKDLAPAIPGYRTVIREPSGSAGAKVALRELVNWFQARHPESAL